jgi:hypothetical protein
MTDKTLEEQVEQLLTYALARVKHAEKMQETKERGSLRYAHYEGEEYAWQRAAEALAGFTPELGEVFDKTTAELWPEYPGGRL